MVSHEWISNWKRKKLVGSFCGIHLKKCKQCAQCNNPMRGKELIISKLPEKRSKLKACRVTVYEKPTIVQRYEMAKVIVGDFSL